MSFAIGQLVEVTRHARWLWRTVPITTPGVVTSIRTDRSQVRRYTVAFGIEGAAGAAVVIPRLKEEDLVLAHS